MSDDIVTKLEFLLKEGAAIIKDQADEIERLRTELDEVKLTARKQLTKLEVEIIRWRRVADAFALAHRKRYGLDGAWDPENLAYDKAVKESQREFS